MSKPRKPRNWHAVNAWQRRSGPMTDKKKEADKNECRTFKQEDKTSELSNLVLNMMGGLLPKDMSDREKELLEESYGKDWPAELGYSTPHILRKEEYEALTLKEVSRDEHIFKDQHGKYYWCDETWSDMCGPYNTYEEAGAELSGYVDWLDNPGEH